MKTHLAKWGHSLAVRIPRPVTEQLGLNAGAAVEIEANQGEIIIRKSRYTLDELLEGITPENSHPEVDWGSPMGREEW